MAEIAAGAGPARALRYAVRPRVVLCYLGHLGVVLATLTLVPCLVSLGFGDATAAAREAAVTLALLVLGGALSRIEAPRDVQANEGMVLVTFVFLLSPLAMAWPLMAGGLGFADALFEGISGVTTTGLSTVGSLAGAPPSFLFARAWMQWYGGLGIVVFSLALVIQPGLVAKGLSATQSPGDDLIGGTRAHARWALRVYGTLTAVAVAGGLVTGLGLQTSVLHALAAVSTGGFAPRDTSLAPLPGAAQAWVLLVCAAGALPLTLLHGRRRAHRLRTDVLQAAALAVATALSISLLGIGLRVLDGMPWRDVVHHAPLMAVSAQTTAGFSSLSPAGLTPGSRLLLVVFMLVGGSVGSTAGGIKILRVLIFGGVLRTLLARAALPHHAVVEPSLGGRRLHSEEIHAALVLTFLFVLVVVLSWLPFVMMGYDALNALFEVASATGTVGLSTGVTSADLPPLLKGVLCADMMLGRLEILAWLVALSPGTWWGRRRGAR